MISKISSFIILFVCIALSIPAQNRWQYYFDKPAFIWGESIPLGNGRCLGEV